MRQTQNHSARAFLAALIPPTVNMSSCGLTHLTNKDETLYTYSNGSRIKGMVDGPFDGIIPWPCQNVDHFGKTDSVIDLSYNQLTRISRGDLLGVTLCKVVLDHNPIMTYQAGWASSMVNQGLSVTAFDCPSECSTATVLVRSQTPVPRRPRILIAACACVCVSVCVCACVCVCVSVCARACVCSRITSSLRSIVPSAVKWRITVSCYISRHP